MAALAVLPYALFAFTIALVTRSSAAGLSIGLIMVLIGELILAQILASLPGGWDQLMYYIPYTSVQIVKEWMGTLVGGPMPANVGRAVMVLIAYSVTFSGIALAAFLRDGRFGLYGNRDRVVG